MTSVRILAMSITCGVISASVISAQDLSRYREFQLGMSVVTVARQAEITPEARVLHRRPALIQELMWQPPRISSPRRQRESVGMVLFSFYNDQLFRMVITYDRERTFGLTVEDLVESISTRYGLALLPGTEIIPSLATGSNGIDTTLARWDDSQHSLNLLTSAYANTFGLVVLSKRLDALAHVATVEANVMNKQEAPQRKIERRQEIQGDRVKQEEARRVNKPTFRP